MVSAAIPLTKSLTSLATCYPPFLGFHGVILDKRLYLSETSFLSLAVTRAVQLLAVSLVVAMFSDRHYQDRPQSASIAAYLWFNFRYSSQPA